ncbi:hypothetical protein GCM10010492_53970 [Saccharothrix mutabilis subsp. mutabilis]|uniref:Uncharacterized protein n=1 Tax=Saccharothrix mutabilis subsp. mutabilis TaxID=66855 RepID=A0ABN0UDZ7_9PSEU
MKSTHLAALIPLAAIALTGAAPPPDQTRVEMVRLAELPGSTLSGAEAVNDAGVVVGYGIATGFTVYPLRWDRPDRPVRLPVPPNTRSSLATGVNRAGVVIGRAVTTNNVVLALRWNPDQRLVELRPLDGGSSEVAAVDDRGTAVGWTRSATGVRAVRWDDEGNPADLGTLPGGTQSSANAINDGGLILGSADDADGQWHPVVWQRDGSISTVPLTTAVAVNNRGTIAGTLEHAVTLRADGRVTDLGLPFGATNSYPIAINDRGTVLGGIRTPEGRQRAVRWDKRGRAVDLGALTPESGSWAERINDHDEAIGLSTSSGQTDHAVFWDRRGRLVDLTPDPSTASDAYDLNNHGVVVGVLGGAYGNAVLWRTRK